MTRLIIILFTVEGGGGGGGVGPSVQVQQSELIVAGGQSARFICTAAGQLDYLMIQAVQLLLYNYFSRNIFIGTLVC